MYNLENIGSKCTIRKKRYKNHLYSPLRLEEKGERKQIKLKGSYKSST